MVTDPQSKRGREARGLGSAYQAAFEAVFSILIGAGLGYWADDRFETAPRYLLIGIVIGFAAFVLRLVRLSRQMQRAHSAEAVDGE